MKKILFLFISILLINMMFLRCQPSGSPETILSGTVRGFEVDSLKITYYKNHTWEGPEELRVPLDSAGRFTVTLPVNSLKEFRTTRSRVVLKPGWKTTMNVYLNEEGEMDSTTFDGDGAAENEVYNKNLTLIFDSYEDINKEPDEFIAFLDSIQRVMTSDVDRLEDANQEFVSMLRNNIAYHRMEWWEDYAKQRFDYEGKVMPDSLLEYSKQFDKLVVFDNAELLNSLFYTSMLEDRFQELVSDNIDFDALLEANKGNRKKAREDYDIASFNLMLDLADSIIPNQEIKSYIYLTAFYKTFLYNISPQLIESLEQNFAGRFQEVVRNTTSINNIASKIDRLKKLSPGKHAPTFSYPDITGNQVSLTDFKGNYVYIDIWATWCGPCIREFPKLKELEKEFGDEIAFISISVDTDKEKWFTYVREKELTGIQLHSEGGSKAEIMDLYMIQGIPRFIMIDPDGNLIDADASRPSHNITRKIFQKWTGLEAVDITPI